MQFFLNDAFTEIIVEHEAGVVGNAVVVSCCFDGGFLSPEPEQARTFRAKIAALVGKGVQEFEKETQILNLRKIELPVLFLRKIEIPDNPKI